MISFWEKNSFLSYDIIILGAGINGLSAACSFKEKFPLKRILILERGSWPVGASTRNAGFACYGTFTEIKSDIANIGLDKALQLVEWRVKGFQNHLKRLGPDKMGYIKTGGGELLFENETYANDELNELNNHLSPFFNGAVYASDFSKVSEFGFNPAGISQYISNSQEGQLDSGLLMKNLWEYATSLGIFIMNGTEVVDYSETSFGCEVVAKHTVLKESLRFTCENLVMTTNAFAKQLLPDLDLNPGRGQILATKPIEGLKFKGIFFFNEGFYYFRNYGNRIIFGGGRNSNIEQEQSHDIALNLDIQQRLDFYLKNLIIPGIDYEIDSRWAGIMAFGSERFPIIKRVSPHVLIGVRMGGMGMALSGYTAQKLTDLL